MCVTLDQVMKNDCLDLIILTTMVSEADNIDIVASNVSCILLCALLPLHFVCELD